MSHEWIVLGVGAFLSVLQLVGSGLLVRFIRHLDQLEEAKERHSREIRDTRSAIAYIEGHLGLEAFRYSDE